MIKNKKVIFTVSFLVMVLFSCCFLQVNSNTNRTTNAILTNAETLSNAKVCWGIKRENNNKQPDLGAKNVSVLNKHSRNSYGKCRR